VIDQPAAVRRVEVRLRRIWKRLKDQEERNVSVFGEAPLLEDIEQVDWVRVLDSCPRKDCSEYATAFASKSREADSAGEVRAKLVYSLLASITSFQFTLDSPNQPLWPAIIRLRKRSFPAASSAVEAYLASATALMNLGDLVESAQRLERASQLSLSLGRNSSHPTTVVNWIDSTITSLGTDPPYFILHRLLKVLLKHRQGNATNNAAVAEGEALKAETGRNWIWARHLYELAVQWRTLGKDEDGARNAQILFAETYTKEADEAVSHSTFMLASRHLVSAIEALSRVANTKDRRDVLHRKLLDYQERSVKEMIEHTFHSDITELVLNAEKAVKGLNLSDAVRKLALCYAPMKVETIRQQVQDRLKTSIIHRLFTTTIINKQGKVVARPPTPSTNNPEECEGLLRAEMFRQAILGRQFAVEGIINPIRSQINLEHAVRAEDFRDIVVNNPFVPPGRELLYARGLHAGQMDTIASLQAIFEFSASDNRWRTWPKQGGCRHVAWNLSARCHGRHHSR
jgi:hypothetical protein